MSTGLRVTCSTGYFFLVMVAYYILKPVRESFFLQEAGYQRLPGVHILVLGVTFVAVQGYAALTRRLSRPALVIALNAIFLASILGFWFVLGPGGAGPALRRNLAWAYYCWVSLFSVFAVTLFWSLAHSLFTPEEGSRWYGVVGAGGIVGAMCGGLLTRVLARELGTENLLAVSGLALIPCALLGLRMAREGVDREPPRKEGGSPPRGVLELFGESAYLRGIAAFVFLSLFISVLDDFRFKQVIQTALPALDARTAFMGGVYAATNVIGMVVSLALTGPLQTRFGPLPGLLTYPALMAVGGVGLLFLRDVDFVFWVIALQQGFAYSIYQSSRELLYLTESSEVKFVAKGFVDTFVFRLGTGLGAVLLLVVSFGDPVTQISAISVPLSLGLAALATWLAGRHRARGKPAGASASGRGPGGP